MATTLSAPLLQRFSMFLAARLGLYFPPPRWADLERGLTAAAADFGLAGPESCIHRLMSAPLQRQQVETLASHLTVGETYFFRDAAVFTALEREVLPALIAAGRERGRRLRLWSAGCCSGEEAYSLAILLDRLIPDLDHWHITLLATDINPRFLARARLGEYREWSFRSAPDWLKANYFTPGEGGVFTLAPRIRRLVSFDYLNLADDTYPSPAGNTSGMDLILCRNVLMYFADDSVRAIVARLRRSLAEHGWLALSSVEGGAALQSGFAVVTFGEASFYRTADSVDQAPPARPEEPLPHVPVRLEPSVLAPSRCPSPTVPAPHQPAAPVAGTPAAQARTCANLGRLDEALRWCAMAVAADRASPELRYLQAVILAERGDTGAAIGGFRQALYLDPDFVLAHFALGNLYRQLGQTRRATRHFDNARSLLDHYPAEQVLPHAEGLTASGLLAILDSTEPIS